MPTPSSAGEVLAAVRASPGTRRARYASSGRRCIGASAAGSCSAGGMPPCTSASSFTNASPMPTP